MDRPITQKKWTLKRIAIYATGLVIAIGVLYTFFAGKNNATLNVSSDRILINEVKKQAFKEYIPLNCTILPITTIYLDITEGGRVEEKYVEDGAIMKKDQPILKLANTDLELSLVNEETAVFNLLTQMQISRNASQQNTIAKLNQMEDVDNAYKEALRVYTANKQLYDAKAISTQEFKQSEQAYNYQLNRKQLTTKILLQDSVATIQEMEQAKQSYDRTKEALKLMHRKVEDLVVKSPIDGQLSSLDAEIGQSKNKGDRIGQIDIVSGYKLRADIDEHYISRIVTGLKGDCVIKDTAYSLVVKKIYTQVKNGKFQVDMEFENSIPKGIKRGQSLIVKLALSDETEAILLPKGAYYQQTAGNWIFKLSPDGSKAYKTDIQTGRQNPDYYEVLQGLKQGDKVITSGYENYDKIQELNIK